MIRKIRKYIYDKNEVRKIAGTFNPYIPYEKRKIMAMRYLEMHK
jgi:hypothetical protein